MLSAMQTGCLAADLHSCCCIESRRQPHLAEATDTIKGPQLPYSLHNGRLALQHVVVGEHQLLAILQTSAKHLLNWVVRTPVSAAECSWPGTCIS